MKQPITAASIAHVHHGVLNNKQEVVIKVQYPGLEHRMKIDIMMMAIFSKSISKGTGRVRQPTGLGRQGQIDMGMQERSMDGLGINFQVHSHRVRQVGYIIWIGGPGSGLTKNLRVRLIAIPILDSTLHCS